MSKVQYVFKKRIKRNFTDIIINISTNSSPVADEVLFTKNSDDIRPYIKVNILQLQVCGLLDTGAVCSILGNNSHILFKEHGFDLHKLPVNQNVKTADGTNLKCLGYMSLPIMYDNKVKVIKFYIVPQITSPMIFGVDFWKQFNLSINLILENSQFQNKSYINSIDINNGLEEYNNLTLSHKHEINSMIKKFENISTEKVGLGRTNMISHRIDTGLHPPIKQRYIPLSPMRQMALEKELDRMLELKVVSPSQSPWNSPVVMVQKPNGDTRLCLDSRAINRISRSDAYPLPYVSQILDKLRDAKYLSSIDLSSAYWQIPFDSEESSEKTAFTVPRRGLFQFNVMCFGLVGASATMQRVMDKLFGPEFDNKVFCFQDDIIIISSSFHEHISLLNRVYEKLKLANFTINMKKSLFCRNELKYLGYVVDKHGLHTDPSKINCILNYPTPTSPKEIKRFLGMCSWYRRFINNFSNISRPLNKLTSKKIKFEWSQEAEESFNQLKTALVSAPILKCPDFTLPFTIHTDASAYAIGSMLTQNHNGIEHPIAYCSRTLNKNEINYSTTERELLAIIYSLEQFRGYVEGQKCKIVTDHASLLWFYKLKNPTGRLSRWSMRLSQFDFEIEHRKGKENVIPDSLSRIKIESIESFTNGTTDRWYLNMIKNCQRCPRKYPNYLFKDNKLYRHSRNKYKLTVDFSWKLVVPKEERLELIKKNHDEPTSAHLGIMKTHKRLSLHYFWPSMYKDVLHYVNKCELCKQYKHVNTARPGLMGKPKQVTKPFEGLSCDLLGPLPNSTSRNKYLLVCSDYFTKYVMLFPIRNATGAAISKIIEKQVFLVHGVCKYIFIDNGPQFVSHKFQSLLLKYNIPNIYYNPPYHPQVNQAERAIRNIVQSISLFVKSEHRRWDENIPELQYALNTSVNATTKFTPYFLMHGRESIIDGNLYKNIDKPIPQSQLEVTQSDSHAEKLSELTLIYEKVRKNILTVHNRNAKYYNMRKRHIDLKVGQIVYKKTFFQSDASKHFTEKLAPKFQKCIVSAKLSPLVYTLKSLEGKVLGNFHIKDILKYDE